MRPGPLQELYPELSREQWRENKALCTYCQIAGLCSIVSAVLAYPEVSKAVRARVAVV
jgi:uncharacterized membrane protein